MHNIEVLEHEVELYVQNINEDHHSTGVFSIKNDQWIAEPIRIEPKVDTDMVKRKINSFIDMIERVGRQSNLLTQVRHLNLVFKRRV